MGFIVSESKSLSNSSISARRQCNILSLRMASAYVRGEPSDASFRDISTAAAFTTDLLRVKGGCGRVFDEEGSGGKAKSGAIVIEGGTGGGGISTGVALIGCSMSRGDWSSSTATSI